MARSSSGDYSAEHIQVLEGLDPVRKRPGMYIGSTGPTGLHHLVWEVVDNAVDEAMAGVCTRIDVTLLADGGVRVADNGRGIPVDEHPQYKGKSAAEIVMTTLHAGGKFGGGGYKVSGGLHGVGVSVVNALSSRRRARGRPRRQDVPPGVRGGEVGPRCGEARRSAGQAAASVAQSKRGHTGTSVTFWPDPDVFEEIEFRYATIAERMQVMAFLNRGLTIALHDERPGHKQSETFKFDGGIVDFVRHLNQSKEPLFKDVGYFGDTGPEGEVEVAWQWNTGYHEGVHSFANGISTTEGGMHVEGFRRALTAAVNRYAKDRNLVKAQGRRVPGRRRARGSHRDRVGAPGRSAVRGSDQGQARQHRDPVAGRSRHDHALRPLVGRAPESRPRRSSPRRRARPGRAPRPSRRAISPGARPRSTAWACPTSSPTARRAIATARSSSSSKVIPRAARRATRATRRRRRSCRCGARSSTSSAASMDKVVANTEIQSLTAAIGGGIGADFDVAKVRYGRVIILADADVDGGHIRTLLITFFYRQMTPLVESGRLYVAQPPLYSVEIGGEKQYIADDAARLRVMEEHPNRQLTFARFKGLGEMDPHELRETCMDPATRHLVQIDVDQASIADDVLSVLMGDDVEARRNWIQHNAKDARFLDV